MLAAKRVDPAGTDDAEPRAYHRQSARPWAFGINGTLSVPGASAALLVAIAWGFRAVTVAGAVCYAVAALLMLNRSAWQEATAAQQ